MSSTRGGMGGIFVDYDDVFCAAGFVVLGWELRFGGFVFPCWGGHCAIVGKTVEQ